MKLLLTILILLCNCFQILSAAPTISQIIQHDLPQANVGILVMNANTGKIIYQHNANHGFTPASITKLFTATSALITLGPTFRFKTWIGIHHDQYHHHRLQGNLFIHFSGDPTLTIHNVNQLIAQVKKTGIRQINGNVILDTSEYTHTAYPLGFMISDTPYCYGAPASSVIVDHNCFYLTIHHNGQVTHGLDRYIHVKNTVKMANSQALQYCIFEPFMNSQNQLQLKGCLPNRPQWSFNMAVQHPVSLAKRVILQALQKNGIHLKGRILTGKAPDHLQQLAQHASQPLLILLKHMLVYSDDLYANTFTRTMGAQRFGVGSFTAGVSVINATVKPMIHSKLILQDGAGLSYYDIIQPQQVAQLLYNIQHHPKLAKMIIPALPIAGVNGTLQNRMKAPGLKGMVFAKTGSMSGVSNLAGYILNPKQTPLIFVIMMNDIRQPITIARHVQDLIVEKLISLCHPRLRGNDTT